MGPQVGIQNLGKLIEIRTQDFGNKTQDSRQKVQSWVLDAWVRVQDLDVEVYEGLISLKVRCKAKPAHS